MNHKPEFQNATSNTSQHRTATQWNACCYGLAWQGLVWRSLGWLGSLSLLGGSVALAQAPIEQPTSTSSPQPVLEIVPQQVTLPNVVDLSTPADSPSEVVPTLPSRATPGSSPVAGSGAPLESNGAYIDSTNYSTGATNYDSPTAIVVTERTSGCRTTLSQSSALASDLCATQVSLSQTQPNTTGNGKLRQAGTPNFVPSGISSPNFARDNGAVLGHHYYNPYAVSSNPYATPNALRLPVRLGNNNTRLMFPLWLPAPITSLFGWRVHPITGETRFHNGVDLGAPLGTPVLAAYAGRVVISEFMGGYGLTVTIGHNSHLPSKQAQEQQAYSEETLYAHLSEIFVKPGDWVEQGAVIGLVGSTGLSTGPHLHFELRQATNEGWVTVDPGAELELALAMLIQSLQYAQATLETSESMATGLGVWVDTRVAGRATATMTIARVGDPLPAIANDSP